MTIYVLEAKRTPTSSSSFFAARMENDDLVQSGFYMSFIDAIMRCAKADPFTRSQSDSVEGYFAHVLRINEYPSDAICLRHVVSTDTHPELFL